jgi:hypothetical protein
MVRKGLAVLVIAASALLSQGATASWQGTFYYFSDEGVLVGAWTAGCGDADGRWGVATENRRFVQGCRASS